MVSEAEPDKLFARKPVLKVGITGGIGSGKTTVCRVFHALGIPVLYADEVARDLMDNDPALRIAITALLGNGAYGETGLSRALVAATVFNDPAKLAALNALVHPVTMAFGESWMQSQQTPYALKEAAIFFETGGEKAVDFMIGIDAPFELRIHRAVQRGRITDAEARARASRQMNNDAKMARCDYIIVNDNKAAVLPQVLDLHQKLLARARNPEG